MCKPSAAPSHRTRWGTARSMNTSLSTGRPWRRKTPPSGWTTRLVHWRSCAPTGRRGGFLADAQPVAAGRDAERLGALSRESSVAVAASTGYHLLGFYPADCWVHSLDEEGLYDLYCGELLEGMLPWRPEPDRRPAQPTAFRAGLVKAAIPAEGAEGRYAVLLRAAARAAVCCGCR